MRPRLPQVPRLLRLPLPVAALIAGTLVVAVMLAYLFASIEVLNQQRCEDAAVNRVALRQDANDTADLGIALVLANDRTTDQQRQRSAQFFEDYRAKRLSKLKPTRDCAHATFAEIERRQSTGRIGELPAQEPAPTEPPKVGPPVPQKVQPPPPQVRVVPGPVRVRVIPGPTRTVVKTKTVPGPVRTVYQDRHVHHHHCYQANGKREIACP